ncbi:MAG: putative phage protein gp47/JayE [Arenicella sp.]|jgi:uncharacterized phage protein gp47/JayE
MTIENRTLEDSVEEVRNAFRSNAPNSDAWIIPNNFWITATVLGGKIWEIYARVRWLITNSLPDTATGEILDRWGNIFNVSRKGDGESTGTVLLTGVDGSVVPVGSMLSLSNGQRYDVTVAAVIASGVAEVSVKAIELGRKSNAIANTPVKLASSLLGVDLTGKVSIRGITGGVNAECDDAYRVRVISRIRKRNRYGTLKDYEDWSREVVDVTRAWAVKSGSSINVYFMMDVKYPQAAPLPADSDTLNTYLNDRCRKPACASVNALLPITKNLEVTINCANLTLDQKNTIQQELDEFLFDEASIGEDFFYHEIQQVLSRIDGLDIVIDCGLVWFAKPGELFVKAAITYV